MKTLVLVLVTLLIFSPVLSHADFETPVEAGDIVLWWNPVYSVPIFGTIITLPWDLFYGTYVWQHADLAIDDDGTVRTSIQKKGVSNSTIGKRFERFKVGILLRDYTLTEDEIEGIVDKAWETEGDYDDLGYWGTYWDTLLFMGRGNFFVAIMEDPNLLYCSEAVELWCSLGIVHCSPLDIYYHAIDTNTDLEIVEIARRYKGYEEK